MRYVYPDGTVHRPRYEVSCEGHGACWCLTVESEILDIAAVEARHRAYIGHRVRLTDRKTGRVLRVPSPSDPEWPRWPDA